MPIAKLNRTGSILVPVGAANEDRIVTVYQNTQLKPGDEFIPGHRIIHFNAFIKNLKAFGKIASLPTTPLPEFTLEDSQTDKLKKTMDLEWFSPRKQLDVFIGKDSLWSQIGSVSLLNPYGFAYRIYSLMDMFTDALALELGQDAKVGVAIKEAGHGLLADLDQLTIHGSYIEEIIVSYQEPQQNHYIYLSANQEGGNTPATGSPVQLGNLSSLGNNALLGN